MKKTIEMKTVKLDIRLSVEEKERLKEKAKAKGVNLSALIREWIESLDVDLADARLQELGKDSKEKTKATPFKSYFKDDKLN